MLGQQPLSHQSALVNYSTVRIASHLQATILLPLLCADPVRETAGSDGR